MTSFLLLDNIEKKSRTILSKVLDTFENIMEKGAFAPMEQMLLFPSYLQIHDISEALLWRKGLIVFLLL